MSARTAIDWPKIPDPRGALVLSVLRQLRDSETWPPERIIEAQFSQIRALVDHARRHVPYYRKLFAELGLESASEVTPETWSRVPVLRRNDILRLQRAVLSDAPPEAHGAVDTHGTTGSSGVPVIVHKTAVTGILHNAITLRDHQWHRRDQTGKLGAIRNTNNPDAQALPGYVGRGWGDASRILFPDAPLRLLSTRVPVERCFEWLEAECPDYLVTLPSIARELAIIALSKPDRRAAPRALITHGEALPDDLPDLCARAWGAAIQDSYSSAEAGYIGLRDPDGKGILIQSESCFLEVLDERDQPVAPGEIGRVIVTPLHNFAMPLLRYEVGDMAVAGRTPETGRRLPVLREVVGRIRGMVKLPDGRSIWLRSHLADLKDRIPFRQVQFVQRAPGALEINLVVAEPLTEGQEETIRRQVVEKSQYPLEISFRYVDDIPRGPGGKFIDIVHAMEPT